jgi:hypothetical protein
MSAEYSHYDDEYYILCADNNENYPLTDLDESTLSSNKHGGIFSSSGPIIQDGYVFPVHLGDPIPVNPEIVDYHEQPNVFSYRVIQDVAQRHELPGVQWLPAYIHHKKKRYEDYVIMHTYKEIGCLDRNKSDYKQRGEFRVSIKKIVLDQNVLDSIPLEERLIFLMEEKTSLVFMHESIVAEIMKYDPKGVRFVKSKDWGMGIGFE